MKFRPQSKLRRVAATNQESSIGNLDMDDSAFLCGEITSGRNEGSRISTLMPHGNKCICCLPKDMSGFKVMSRKDFGKMMGISEPPGTRNSSFAGAGVAGSSTSGGPSSSSNAATGSTINGSSTGSASSSSSSSAAAVPVGQASMNVVDSTGSIGAPRQGSTAALFGATTENSSSGKRPPLEDEIEGIEIDDIEAPGGTAGLMKNAEDEEDIMIDSDDLAGAAIATTTADSTRNPSGGSFSRGVGASDGAEAQNQECAPRMDAVTRLGSSSGDAT
ncbi:unnamed protein product [Amoebophrya sp. A120]|nr:unnamed protein product [Amoebophrya sp. A120]|eukprot:GSA120T00004725001.1